ncbi:anillin [Adelges cooleyi]|uniref:anillin n=1 Tax=Adelges cooleyi TaxID=133065 RepID=UPI00217F3801|nr:anillin [Adelges cooleyi]
MDEFIERMKSRTNARQELLQSLKVKNQESEMSVDEPEPEPESETDCVVTKSLLRDRTKTILNRLGALHSDTDQLNLSSPVHAVHDIVLGNEQENRNNDNQELKQTSCKLKKLSQLVSKVNEWQENDIQTFQTNSKDKKDILPEKTTVSAASCISSPVKNKTNDKKTDARTKTKCTVTFAPTVSSIQIEKRPIMSSPKKITPVLPKPASLNTTANFKSTSSPKKVDGPWQLSVAERKEMFEKQISNGGLAAPAPVTTYKPQVKDHQQDVKTKTLNIEANKCAKPRVDDKPQVKNVILKRTNFNNPSCVTKADSDTKHLPRTEFTCTGHEQFNQQEVHTPRTIDDHPKVCSPAKTPPSSAYTRSSSAVSLLNDVKIVIATPPKPGCLYPNISFGSDENDLDNQSEEEPMSTDVAEKYCNTNDISPIVSGDANNDNISNRPKKRHISAILNNTDGSSTSSLATINGDDEEHDDYLADNADVKRTKNNDTQDVLNYSSITDFDSPIIGLRSVANTSVLGSPLHSSSFTYINHTKNEEIQIPTGGAPSLVHTVSTYRKQQQQQLKPSAMVIRRTAATKDHFKESDEENIDEHDKESDDEDELDRVVERVHELEAQIPVQEARIAQATQALNLCQATTEFAGSSEQVEAERVLLLAGLKRNACLMEAQRLRVEKTLLPKGQGSKSHILKSSSSVTSSLLIKDLSIPIRWDYIRNISIREDKRCHFVCAVQCSGVSAATAQVIATKSVEASYTGNGNRCGNNSGTSGIPVGYIEFPEELRVDLGNVDEKEVDQDFKCTVEVYGLVVDHNKNNSSDKFGASSSSHHSHTRGDSKFWFTPTKHSKKKNSAFHGGNIESPGGPAAVRSTSFQLLGYFVFSKRELRRTQFTLSKVQYDGPLSEGVVRVKLELEDNEDSNEDTILESLTHEGFLTMFNDVSGLGAWYRRWFKLRNGLLSYWKYPDHADDETKIPIDTIDLGQCITQQIGPCNVELCARPNTLLLECTRPLCKNDGNCDSLITRTDPRTGQTTIRNLLSADTKQERQEWCDKINSTLTVLNRRQQRLQKKTERNRKK